MDIDGIEKLISDWYVGEIRGEMYFSTLAAQRDIEQGERQKWSLLAALEVAMGERLRRELIARGSSIPEPDQSVANLKKAAENMRGTPWNEAMLALQPRFEGFVKSIRLQAVQITGDGEAIAWEYVAHEEALLEFVLKEREGGDGTPAITRLLCDEWGFEQPTVA